MPAESLTDDLKTSAIDEIFATNDNAKSDFFNQVENAFAAAQPARNAVNSGDQATVAAQPLAAPSKATSAAPSNTPDKVAASGKVPGPPNLTSPATGQEGQPLSPVAPQPEEFNDIPRDFKPGQIKADKWQKLHAKADHYTERATKAEKELNELRAKLTQGAAQTPPPEFLKQLETVQKERDEILSRLESVAVERSPRFEQMFKPRQEAAISMVKDSANPAHIPKLEQLLTMPNGVYRNSQLKEILQEYSDDPISQNKIVMAVAEMDKIASERENYARQGKELYKQWMTEEQTRAQTQQQEAVKKAMGEFETELSDWAKGVPYLQLKNGDNEHNSKVQQRIETAKQVFSGGLDWRDLGRAALWASIGPDIAAQAQGLAKELETVKSELASLRTAQPGISNDAGGNASAGDDIPSDTGYADAIARRVQQMGLMR